MWYSLIIIYCLGTTSAPGEDSGQSETTSTTTSAPSHSSIEKTTEQANVSSVKHVTIQAGPGIQSDSDSMGSSDVSSHDGGYRPRGDTESSINSVLSAEAWNSECPKTGHSQKPPFSPVWEDSGLQTPLLGSASSPDLIDLDSPRTKKVDRTLTPRKSPRLMRVESDSSEDEELADSRRTSATSLGDTPIEGQSTSSLSSEPTVVLSDEYDERDSVSGDSSDDESDDEEEEEQTGEESRFSPELVKQGESSHLIISD